MAAARDLRAARYRAAVSSALSNRRQHRADDPLSAPGSAGQGLVGSTAEFLSGDWSVVRRIRDHRSGQVGSFHGQASFRPSSAGDVLAYDEHGELQFGGHRGPASRSLLYMDAADGSADVRFADGRDFYRLDLRHGAWDAEHPCGSDRYLVTVTRIGADSFAETWRVTGPGKDYELSATYTRAGCEFETGGRV
jgi:hypothetical protein